MRGQLMKNWAVILFIILSAFATASAQSERVLAEAFRLVNIRTGPATTNVVIGQLNPGDVVQVLGRNNTSNDWLLVESNGVTGWVAYFVVSVRGNPDSLPLIDQDQVTPTPPSAPAPASLAASELAIQGEIVSATTFRRANIRTAPSVDAPILIVLQRGESIEVVGRSNVDNDWLRVRTSAGLGWIAYFLVAVDGDLSQLPIASSTLANDTTAQAITIPITTRYNINLRESPLATAQVVETIPFDTLLTANGRSSDGRWVRVEYEDSTAWVLATLVASEQPISQLPIVN
jgi:uncharacterized protein YraI